MKKEKADINIKKELSILTTVDELAISRLFDKVSWCICDAVEQAIKKGSNIASIDLEFGILYVYIMEDSVKYKFVPSPTLDTEVINTIVNEQNQYKLIIEKTLVNKLTKIYKDLF